MKDSFFIGVYWGVRKEEMEDCITKVKATVDLLSSLDDSFVVWYKTTRPRKGELFQPIDTSRPGVEALLLKGRNYDDTGQLLDDLGYLVYLKSEKDYSKAHILSITCGCYFEKTTNSVTLNIGKNEAYTSLTEKSYLEHIYRKLIEIWKPDRGVVRCNDDEIWADTF